MVLEEFLRLTPREFWALHKVHTEHWNGLLRSADKFQANIAGTVWLAATKVKNKKQVMPEAKSTNPDFTLLK
jgi:hypothetical protein